MGPSELADLFESNPDAAFRLTLSSGDTVEVTRPQQTLVGPGTVYVNQFDGDDARIATGTRIISIVNIAMVERVDRRKPRGRHSRT